MASNLTEITDAIENLNATFEPINTTDIINVAIQSTNEASNGWTGLTVFIIMCGAIAIHIFFNKQGFNIFDRFGLLFFSMSVWIDIGTYLLIWGILASIQIFIFIYTVFIVLCTISLLRKDLTSGEF